MKEHADLILILAIFVVIFLFFGVSGPPEPNEFVNNRTVYNYSNMLFNYEITSYPSNVELIEFNRGDNVSWGIVGDTWNLRFGKIPVDGNKITRNIEIANVHKTPVRIEFNVYGNITPMITFSDNDFVLKKDERKTIDVYLISDEDIGNYFGQIDIISRKPKYHFIPV